MASFLDPEYWRKAQSPQGNSAYGAGGLLDQFLALPQATPYRPNYNPVGGGQMGPLPINGGSKWGFGTDSENTGSGDNPDHTGSASYPDLQSWWEQMGSGPNGLLGSMGGSSPIWQALKGLGSLSPFKEPVHDTGNMITSGGDYGNNDEYQAALQAAQQRGMSAGMDNATPGHLGMNVRNDLGNIQQQQLGPVGPANPFAGFQIQQPQYMQPNNNGLAQQQFMTGGAPHVGFGFQSSTPERALMALLQSQPGYGSSENTGSGDSPDHTSIWDWSPQDTSQSGIGLENNLY